MEWHSPHLFAHTQSLSLSLSLSLFSSLSHQALALQDHLDDEEDKTEVVLNQISALASEQATQKAAVASLTDSIAALTSTVADIYNILDRERDRPLMGGSGSQPGSN